MQSHPRPAAIFLCLLSALLSGPAAQAHPPQRVLVLHSYHKGLAWTDSIIEGIEARFAASGRHLDVSHEFMDTKRIFSSAYLNALTDLYRMKYAVHQIDVIIASDDHAFQFLLAHHQELFSSTPVVFCGVNDFQDTMLEGRPLFTGVVENFDIRTTLETALTLQPQARRVVAIVDQTVTGRANRRRFDEAMTHLSRPLEKVLLEHHSMEEVRAFVARLTSRDIVLWLCFTADRLGNFFSFEESAALISEKSGAPLYSLWDFHLGHGIVGGMLTNGRSQGQAAAGMALKILTGQPAHKIPIIRNSPNRFMFDHHQLQRYGLLAVRLPAGSVIINQPTSFYFRYKRQVWMVVGTFLGLTVAILVLLFNVSSRIKAEKALRASRNRYQNIFNTTTVALFEADCTPMVTAVKEIAGRGIKDFEGFVAQHPELLDDLAGRIIVTDVNPAAVRLYRADGREALLGSMKRLLSAPSYEAFKTVLVRMFQRRTYFEAETVIDNRRHEPVDIIASAVLPQNERDYAHLLINVVDITDRKRSEAALRQSEDRFRTVFRDSATGMALVNPDGYFLKVNRALSQLVGYSHQEMRKMGWDRITHPQDTALVEEMIRQILDSKSAPPAELRLISEAGQVVWVLLSLSAISENNQLRYLIFQSQDISQIKAAQFQLREREKRYRQVFEAALSGVYIVRADGEILMCNQVFTEMLGFFEPGQIVGTYLGEYYKDPHLRRQLVEKLQAAGKLEHINVELVRRDGTLLQGLINAVGRYDELGQLIEIQGYLMDITRQKQLEAQLLHAQKMESVGTMAGGVAHDFNNLLTGILGNISLMLMEKSPDHHDYQRLKHIEQFVQSGSDLTRQLLGFAKGGKYEIRPINLNQLIEKNTHMFSRTRKEIRVHTELAGDLWPVEADSSQIDQVLYNLYVNAWQAMEHGGDLHVRTCNRTLEPGDTEPHGASPGNYIEIVVADTGLGMDKVTLERIFDPFFTTKTRGRGTGLGLASAYGIIKNHNGFITVMSEPTKGATFQVYLPASNKKAVDMTATTAPQRLTSGDATLLLVDDEEMVLETTSDMLNRLGYRVIPARSGEDALSLYQRHSGEIDLVILDMIMPGMGGAATFDGLRQIDREVAVILSSGYSADGQAAEILKRGCRGFLQKPFSLQQLSEKIQEVQGASSVS